ncbi:phospho-sugar mutase [Mesoplasma melaleucae]|uniref:Phosphoglucomutase/phosphomannomutase n=1 Tax=Mesoplasma melaleucae TaxID=81459 RepID=A0A2K8NX05_9MOLU|nr:phospho-sugar mutase [Mesoplasma melaleucae]ATZ17728.1 phosphoglucomutase/phosphomannomutase [Mesoplasma melaleucae]
MVFNKNNKVYLEWFNNNKLDEEMKNLLQNANDEELHAAFEDIELEFGTAGIRGVLGAGPGRFNIYTIKKVTIAFAELLKQNYANRLNDGVVIGHDNRHNSKAFAQVVAEVLSSFGIKAYLFKDNEMMPTPVVSYSTKALNCIGGIVITASHNPSEYNGYKIYDSYGSQLQDEQTAIIANRMDQITDILNWECKTDKTLIKVVDQSVIDSYVQMIKNLEFYIGEEKSKKALKIIFSAVNGTGSKFTPRILRESGYDVIEVEEHAFEDETFKNVVNPNPEFDSAWKIPLEYGVKHNADIIIMNDPDADRFGMAIKHHREFIRLDGNQTGSILIDWKLANLKRLNKLPKNPALYSSFVTSDLGDRIAHEKYGVKIVKTLTGFKWMGREIAKEVDNRLNFVFAYEESYGYVIDDSARDKDGIQASILIAEAAWFYKKQNKTLVDYLEDLFKEMGAYYTFTLNLNFKPEEKKLKIEPLMKSLRATPLTEIAGLKVIKVEDYIDGMYNMPGQDLLKFYLEDKSWFAVRPSGTEPKLKIYFIGVGETVEAAQAKVNKILEELKIKMNI